GRAVRGVRVRSVSPSRNAAPGCPRGMRGSRRMLRLKTWLKEKGWARLALALGAMCIAAVAGAAEPRPWQFGMQPPATEVDERLSTFHDWLLLIIAVITAVVLGLLVWVI